MFNQQTENLLALLPYQLYAAELPTCNPPTLRTVATCRDLTASSGLSGTAQGIELQIDHKSRDGITWGANYSVEQMHPHATTDSLAILSDIGDKQILHKVNANIGYGWDAWTADIRMLYTSPAAALTLVTLPTPHAALESSKAIVTLSPRVSWSPTDYAMIELAAENLWPYRLSQPQRVESSYFLTLKLSY